MYIFKVFKTIHFKFVCPYFFFFFKKKKKKKKKKIKLFDFKKKFFNYEKKYKRIMTNNHIYY